MLASEGDTQNPALEEEARRTVKPSAEFAWAPLESFVGKAFQMRQPHVCGKGLHPPGGRRIRYMHDPRPGCSHTAA